MITIVSKKLHPAIIATFHCLQRRYISTNISTTGLLYLFGLWILKQLRISYKIKYIIPWPTFKQILINISHIFFELLISINIEGNLTINSLNDNLLGHFNSHLILFIFFILIYISFLYRVRSNRYNILDIFLNESYQFLLFSLTAPIKTVFVYYLPFVLLKQQQLQLLK